MRGRPSILGPLAVLLLLGGCAAEAGGEVVDLGDFPTIGKGDYPVWVEVPFAVPPAVRGEPGVGPELLFRTTGRLAVTTRQDASRSDERLQLVVESPTYRRRSWRGRKPNVTIPASRTRGGDGAYSLHVLNWGDDWGYGTLRVETEVPLEPGIEIAWNSPDCDDGCEDPAGGLRKALLDAIQSATESIDVAIYGLNDPAIVEALGNAAEAGVTVRLVTDETSEDEQDSRSYWPAFFGEGGLTERGAQVEAVRSYALMHHKFFLIDAHTDHPLVVTGSTNLTTAGLEQNHNHATFIRGVPALAQAYQDELDQLLRHCASERLDGREARCQECSPACTEDQSEEGPFGLPDGEIEVYFSPADDAMRALRGEAVSTRAAQPDPACAGEDATCVCRISGSQWACDYCALGAEGWGLLENPRERILMSMYSATDQCFALGLVRAARRGVPVTTVWDFVKAGSGYSRDDWLCSEGVATFISDWGGGSAQVRNHNKLVVVDDVVFDGSLNLSASGAGQNNENSLVIRNGAFADRVAGYIESEAALLQRRGATPRDPSACLCKDLVDNDGDGLGDGADPDCDGARPVGEPG